MAEAPEPSIFSIEAQEIISYSREEALRLSQDCIDTCAFFLGILRQRSNQAYEGLRILSFDFEKAKTKIEGESRPKRNVANLNSLPLTKQAEKCIRVSVLEAKSFGEWQVSSKFLLLSMLRIKESIVWIVFEQQKISYDDVRSLFESGRVGMEEAYSPSAMRSESEKSPPPDAASHLDDGVGILMERRSRVSIRENLKAVLNVEEESNEIANLLISLGFDQGMMFGLFGRWGRGKTFFWRSIWKNLEENERNPFTKVEFHAWKFQDTPATWAYLYETMAATFFKKPVGNNILAWMAYYRRVFSLNYKRKGLEPILAVFWSLFFGTLIIYVGTYVSKHSGKDFSTIIKYFGIPASFLLLIQSLFKILQKEAGVQVKDLFLKYSKKYSAAEYLGIQGEIQKEMLTLLKLWIPASEKGSKRLLLFIDDIDRCNESKVVQIIDSIRIMLDDAEISCRMVVVAAVDERILKLAISNKYSDTFQKNIWPDLVGDLDIEGVVKEYMDKLFIGGIKLKSISKEGRNDILSALAEGKVNPAYRKLNWEGIDDKDKEQYSNKKSDAINEQLKAVLERLYFDYRREPEEGFDLEAFELAFLRDAIASAKFITPRMIRIFYYRYLLAKRFLANALAANKELFFEWNDTMNDKSVLPFLILDFSLQSTESLAAYIKRLFNLDASKSTMIAQFSIFGRKYSMAKQLMDEILQVVEVVVPY